MAAMRSVLTTLGRRCGSSGSSAAASMGGRGLEIHQLFRPAAPRTLPFGSAAVRNAEGWRHFSTAGREQANKAEGGLRMLWQRGREQANKAEGGLRMLWQRAKNRVENANVAESSRAVLVYSAVTLGATTCYLVTSMWDIYHWPRSYK